MLRFQPHNPKVKHKVYDVGGESAYEELVFRLVDILDDDYDPSTVVVLGHVDDGDDSYFGLMKRIKAAAPEMDEAKLRRLLHIGTGDMKADNKRPWSLAGESQAEQLAKMLSERNGAYNAEGKDHFQVMDERQDQYWLRPRTIVNLWQGEKYLDLLLDKLRKPVEFYSVGIFQQGIKVRPGYGEPEAQGPIFTPLSDWDVEPMREIVDELLIEGGIHVFAGLFESYKSMFALELSASLLAGRPVAGHFESHPENVDGVVYLCLDIKILFYKGMLNKNADTLFRIS